MNRGSRMTSISAIIALIGMMKKSASRTEKDARKEMLTMAKEKHGKWLEVSMEVGEFDGDVSGKIELSIVSGKCSECKCYSYSLMQYTPVMPPYCSKCGALNGRKEL